MNTKGRHGGRGHRVTIVIGMLLGKVSVGSNRIMNGIEDIGLNKLLLPRLVEVQISFR